MAFAFVIANHIQDEEPKSFKEAVESGDRDQWLAAMEEQLKSLYENQTWTLVENPKYKKIVGSKWVFKRKEGILGVGKPRYKARLVAKGFTQSVGLDFDEVFSPMVKHRSIRLLFAMVANLDLELEQMDVETAFCMVS